MSNANIRMEAQRYYVNSDTITLPDFIRKDERRYENATGELTNILLAIALATKIVAKGVNRAGLASLLGLAGKTNVQGEEVQKLDVFSDDVFYKILGNTGDFKSMVSEERENVFSASESRLDSKYAIAFDPLDGSSNIDVNVAIGSIWGIYQRISRGKPGDPKDVSDFMQPGKAQVAAGYAIFGSSTMFVYSSGHGVNGFTLDPTIGEFILTHQNMTIPEDGSIYSCNQGNFVQWSDGIKEYVKWAQEIKDNRPYSLRYVGSLVADFHRTLLKGGVFLYPPDKKNTLGKLRLLYECAPLAFIANDAKGSASDGSQPIIEIMPQSIHQRVPLYIGSKKMVKQIEEYVKKFDAPK